MCIPAMITDDDSAGDKRSNRPSSDHPSNDRPPDNDGRRPNNDRKPSSPPREPLSHNSVDEIRSKPLVELLRIAEVQGVISGWTVNGPSIVLQRDGSHILVRAVDAAALLVRLMSEHES